MNTGDIEKILKKDPQTKKGFLGVFAANKIPVRKMKANKSIIINSERDGMSGEHWLSVYVVDDETVEFFDSLGLTPETYDDKIYEFLKDFENINFNKVALQKPESNACGPYCIYYLIMRYYNLTIKQIEEHLKKDKNRDETVIDYLRKYHNLVFEYESQN